MKKTNLSNIFSAIKAISLCLCLGLFLLVNASSVRANESVGHNYSPDIIVPPSTHVAKLDEYSRQAAQVTFSSSIAGIGDIDGCSDPDITCKNFSASTATVTYTCDGTPSLNGGWAQPVYSGTCWANLEACHYAGTINEICNTVNAQADPSRPFNTDFAAYSKCTGTPDKGICAFENNASPNNFTTTTGDDMFKLRAGASAFLDYTKLGGIDTPYRLVWVERNGGDNSRGLMIPSGPLASGTLYEDYRRFMSNPPSFVTVDTRGCYPLEVTLCKGDISSDPPSQDGKCGSLHATYVSSAPPNDTPDNISTKCSKGMDTPVTLVDTIEPNRYEWNCNGMDGGQNVSCFALKPLNGQCGSADGSSSYTQPTQNLCAKGNETAITENSAANTWNWQCLGIPGSPLSTDASCSANIIVDGSCGSAAGTDQASAPSGAALCSLGTASGVTGTSCSWNWTCSGINGGTDMTCSANKVTSCQPLNVTANWRYFGTKSNSLIFNGPGGRMRNNCANGYTPTELGDDADSSHTLGEDNYKGGDRSQLCISTGSETVTVKSEWNLGGCTAGMVHTGVFDSNDTNTDPTSKRYRYKHNLNEEDNTADEVYWCLGLDGPDAAKYNLVITNPWSGSCAAGETKLVNAYGTEWNVNNEDGSKNRSVCMKITPVAGANCSTCGGGCGTANGVPTGVAPSGASLCSSGTSSSVTSAGESFLWTCTGYGSTSYCSAPKAASGVCGDANGVETPFAPTTDLCIIGDDANMTETSTTFDWTCLGINGGPSDSCSAPKPLCALAENGACGAADGNSYPDAAGVNSAGLCYTGTSAAVTGAGPWSWTCVGSNGGTDDTCSASVAPTCSPAPTGSDVNGTCGSAHGGSYANTTAVNSAQRCLTGTATSASLSGSTFSWSCNGSGTGTNDSCTASQSVAVVNGSCSSTAGACTAGSVSSDNGATACGTTRTWSCVGSGGGSTANCSKANAACVVNGSCSSTAGACSAGSVSSDNGATACGTTRTWSCVGSGGGSTANCSKANAACAVNGACSTTAGACTAGTPANDDNVTACDLSRTWDCVGSGGGTTANCTKFNGLCGGGGGGGGCFAAGTQITLADGSTKNIEDVQVNDEVLSFDKKAEYGSELAPHRVTHFYKMGEKQTYLVHGTKVTGDHKLMTTEGLKEVETLKEDDMLVLEDGSTKAAGKIEKGPIEPVFNFTVEDVHTYVANGMRSGNMTLFPEPPEGVYTEGYIREAAKVVEK